MPFAASPGSDTSSGGAVRQPRAILRINGQPIGGWVRWEVEQNDFTHPDTMHVSFALGGLPVGKGVDWFATQDNLDVEVFAGFPADPANYTAADLTSVLLARADELNVRAAQGVLELECRDLTSILTDVKTSEKFQGLTSSQVVEQMAARYGLIPKVTPTTTRVARYYQIEHVALQDDRPVWDLLTWLAKEEQFDCYVKGYELHFHPKVAPDANPYPLQVKIGPQGQYTGAFLTFDLTRELTIAKDIAVTVRSWNKKSKKAHVVKAVRSKSGGKHVQEYSFTIPGLTPQQAQERANQLLAEISKHEMKLAWTAPADPGLTMGHTIHISGTGTAFDQAYYPDTIERSMSADEGFTMRVTAKNHSPGTEPQL